MVFTLWANQPGTPAVHQQAHASKSCILSDGIRCSVSRSWQGCCDPQRHAFGEWSSSWLKAAASGEWSMTSCRTVTSTSDATNSRDLVWSSLRSPVAADSLPASRLTQRRQLGTTDCSETV